VLRQRTGAARTFRERLAVLLDHRDGSSAAEKSGDFSNDAIGRPTG
jgi:hypothetical protein